MVKYQFIYAFIYCGFDRTWFVYILPSLILSLTAQFAVQSTFNKYSKVRSVRGYSGAQTARMILNSVGLQSVTVNRIAGSLTDNYNPQNKTLNLSEQTFAETSISAVGVAAHEAGHAIQDLEKYLPNRIRSAILPMASIGSAAGPYMAFIGLFMRYTIMTYVGIGLFAFAVMFYIVTLPVEIDASRRAIKILEHNAILNDEELRAAKKVLTAAAFTYIASAITAFMSLLRLILLSNRDNR